MPLRQCASKCQRVRRLRPTCSGHAECNGLAKGPVMMTQSKHITHRLSILLLAMPALLLLCNACGTDNSSSGSGYSPPVSSGSLNQNSNNYCSAQSGDDSCDHCVKSKCCPEVQACSENAECTNLAECANSCTTISCQNSCEQQHPKGVTAVVNLGDCMLNYCESVCN